MIYNLMYKILLVYGLISSYKITEYLILNDRDSKWNFRNIYSIELVYKPSSVFQ